MILSKEQIDWKITVTEEEKISKIIGFCLDLEKKVKEEEGFNDYGGNDIHCNVTVLRKSERKELVKKLFEIIPFDLWRLYYGNNFCITACIKIKNDKYDFNLCIGTFEYTSIYLTEIKEDYFVENINMLSYFLDSDEGFDSY